MFWFRINKQIRIIFRLYGVNSNHFLSNNFFYRKPREIQIKRLFAHCKLANINGKMRKMVADYWARTIYLCHNRLTSQPLYYRCEYIYWLNASFSIHNIIYLFNINSRKLDGQYRSWIEYLNERY